MVWKIWNKEVQQLQLPECEDSRISKERALGSVQIHPWYADAHCGWSNGVEK